MVAKVILRKFFIIYIFIIFKGTTKNVNFEYWMKICTFAGYMKTIVMKISAVLLVVWYCMSIIGFDVHTCKGTGRSFVATFIEGTACSDIHPEHHCCSGSCAHHHETSCCHKDVKTACCSSGHQDSKSGIDTDECCTDDYQVIQLSGCRADDDRIVTDFGFLEFSPILQADFVSVVSADYSHSLILKSKHPESWDIVSDDLCVIFNVFRI